jgi:hypothetical protein
MIGGIVGAIGSGQGSSLGNTGPAYGGDTILGDFDMGSGPVVNFGTAAGAGSAAGTTAAAFGGGGMNTTMVVAIAGVIGLALWARSRKK